MVNVIITNNVLVVDTGIAVAAMGKSRKMVREQSKEASAYEVKMGDNAELSKFGITCNSVIDGKAAVTIILPVEVEGGNYQQYVKDTYGDALIASVACEDLAAKAEARSRVLDAFFTTPATTEA